MALTAGNGISFNRTRPSHTIYLVDGGEIYDRGVAADPDSVQAHMLLEQALDSMNRTSEAILSWERQ